MTRQEIELIQKLDNFKRAFIDLHIAFSELPDGLEDSIFFSDFNNDNYPFHSDFSELCFETSEWIEGIKDIIERR